VTTQFDRKADETVALDQVAYHETGHAIMAYLFGRAVHSITLVRNVEGTYNGM